MRRRTFLATTSTALAAPMLARGATANVLRFVPQTDVAVLDPIWTTTYPTRDHGYMVFDTLFGMDSSYAVSPQMADGAVAEHEALPLPRHRFQAEKVPERHCVGAGVSDQQDPSTGFVPVHIVASVNGTDRHPRDIAVAVNGTIQAVGNTFTLAVGNAGELVSVMVPESAFHKGKNTVQVLLQR